MSTIKMIIADLSSTCRYRIDLIHFFVGPEDLKAHANQTILWFQFVFRLSSINYYTIHDFPVRIRIGFN